MNIIYKNETNVSISNNANNELMDCNIYFPSSMNFDIVNIYIDDKLIDTSKTHSEKSGYYLYKINPTLPIVLDETTNHSLHICGINLSEKKATVFSAVDVKITTEKYNEFATSKIATYLNQSISEKYEKINKLTRLCIDVYNSIQEVTHE